MLFLAPLAVTGTTEPQLAHFAACFGGIPVGETEADAQGMCITTSPSLAWDIHRHENCPEPGVPRLRRRLPFRLSAGSI